jgi:hypothetical protein
LPPFITHGMAIISWLSALPLFANSIFWIFPGWCRFPGLVSHNVLAWIMRFVSTATFPFPFLHVPTFPPFPKIVCFGILQWRRYNANVAGELGGPARQKHLSFLIFFLVWLVYIVYSSLVAYCLMPGFWWEQKGGDAFSATHLIEGQLINSHPINQSVLLLFCCYVFIHYSFSPLL